MLVDRRDGDGEERRDGPYIFVEAGQPYNRSVFTVRLRRNCRRWLPNTAMNSVSQVVAPHFLICRLDCQLHCCACSIPLVSPRISPSRYIRLGEDQVEEPVEDVSRDDLSLTIKHQACNGPLHCSLHSQVVMLFHLEKLVLPPRITEETHSIIHTGSAACLQSI